MAERIMGWLAAPNSDSDGELQKLASAMVVEASVSALVRVETVAGHGLSDLQYLPVGTPKALLSSPGDFEASKDDDHSWFLVSLPLLGRLQPEANDGLPPSPGGAPATQTGASLLQIDPIVQIDRARPTTSPAPIAGLTLCLANWAESADQHFGLAEFDLARHRYFARLDPSSLRESWYRLNLPAPRVPVPARLPAVMAAPNFDGPGALGRPEVLRRVYNPRRTFLPPRQPLDDDQLVPVRSEAIVWKPQSLFVVQTDSLPIDFVRPTSPFTDPAPAGTSRDYITGYGFIGVGAHARGNGHAISIDRPASHFGGEPVPRPGDRIGRA
jgi:hypothetical protein